jgi:hypothetical protein
MKGSGEWAVGSGKWEVGSGLEPRSKLSIVSLAALLCGGNLRRVRRNCQLSIVNCPLSSILRSLIEKHGNKLSHKSLWIAFPSSFGCGEADLLEIG